jgi:hypothetical protein
MFTHVCMCDQGFAPPHQSTPHHSHCASQAFCRLDAISYDKSACSMYDSAICAVAASKTPIDLGPCREVHLLLLSL